MTIDCSVWTKDADRTTKLERNRIETPGGIDVKSLKDLKAQLLANPAVRQAYDAQAPEFELARELIAARMKAAGARHPCEQSNALPVPWGRVPWCAWSL
jgi:hypothetical protein